MKKVILLFISAIFLLQIFSCQKKMSGHVEVSGRVVDYFTGEPAKVNVSLIGDDATSAKNSAEATITLATCTTNIDGTFDIKTRPSKGGRYYIGVYGGEFKRLSIQEGINNDLGTFLGGSHEFTCNITVIPRSDSSVIVQTNGGGTLCDLAPGTSTVVQGKITCYAKNWTGYFQAIYTPYKGSCSGYDRPYSINVPITNLNSVLSTTIFY